MLPPAGSEARWREEVMPRGTSGEVMLTLSRQEGEKNTEVADNGWGLERAE
ncbi:hydrolase-like protein [Mesotoga sp. B105.6.4]|nr:hydrolase-like protein [Mesotoga sp. B105.6.4]